MTNTTNTIDHRLTELEHNLQTFRQVQAERNNRIMEIIADLRGRSEQQDSEIAGRITRIHQLLWQVIGWTIASLTGALFMIILKASNLL